MFDEWLEKNKEWVFVIGWALAYIFLVRREITPFFNLNLVTIIGLLAIAYWIGETYLSVHRMKWSNTDKIKAENFFNTCTKMEMHGKWAFFWCGGVRSDSMIIPSTDGKILIVVPKYSFFKKGTVYDIRATLHKCSSADFLPPDAKNDVVANGLSSKIIYFGFTPSGSFKFDENIVDTSFVTHQNHRINSQDEEITTRLVNFNSYVKGYSVIREDLDPKEKTWYGATKTDKGASQ